MGFTSHHTDQYGKWTNNGGSGRAVECGYDHKKKEAFIHIVDEYMRGAHYDYECSYADIFNECGNYSDFKTRLIKECGSQICEELLGRITDLIDLPGGIDDENDKNETSSRSF